MWIFLSHLDEYIELSIKVSAGIALGCMILYAIILLKEKYEKSKTL